jgi:hypothetical protein
LGWEVNVATLIVLGIAAVVVSAALLIAACVASARFSRLEEEHEKPIFVRRTLPLARKRRPRGTIG